MHDLFAGAEFLRDNLQSIRQRAFFGKQGTIGPPQRMNGLAGETAALQTNQIEARQAGTISDHGAIGNDIMLDPGHATDHRVATEAHELMDRRQTADDRVILNLDVTTEGRIIDKNDIV